MAIGANDQTTICAPCRQCLTTVAVVGPGSGPHYKSLGCAAPIKFAKAPGEAPVHPPETGGADRTARSTPRFRAFSGSQTLATTLAILSALTSV